MPKRESQLIHLQTYTGHKILSKQHYRKGARTGVWEFYEDNALAWTYDFDSTKVNFIQPEDATTIADNSLINLMA